MMLRSGTDKLFRPMEGQNTVDCCAVFGCPVERKDSQVRCNQISRLLNRPIGTEPDLTGL